MTGRPSPVRFCTVADSGHFVGLVALVNSLRWHGHHDPVTVVDVGLTAAERSEIERHCELVAPPSPARHPWLLAPFACLARPADVVVAIDCDVIVTAPLDPIIDAARRGQVCAFPDWMPNRWFAEWETVFALPSRPRHQTYVNSGFVAWSTEAFPDLLAQWAERCDRMAGAPIASPAADLEDPTALPDQDALNALLMTVVAPSQLAVQPAAAGPQGTGQLSHAELRDQSTLSCSYEGTPTTLLHSWGLPKPWQPEARTVLRRTAYVACLRRLLVHDDVAVRSALPRVTWLQPGIRGALSFRYLTTRAEVRRQAALRLRRS